MHPLGRLIAQRMEHPDHHWSVRDVERRARERGESLSKTTVGALRREMTPHITRVTVYGLAAGIGVTPLTVANAALESWGIDTHPAEVTDSLATIAIDPTLSDRDRRQLRTLITDMRDTAKESVHAVEDSPESGASSEAGQAQEVSARRPVGTADEGKQFAWGRNVDNAADEPPIEDRHQNR
jgi:hypothetical protein